MSNRNTEAHFANTPIIEVARSKFDRGCDYKCSFNNGDIVPIYCQQVIPGDTISMKMSSVVRMMTPIVPVMDNLAMDTYFFFVPWRLLWNHTKQFVGENDTSPWAQNVEYEIPQIEAPAGTGWDVKSLAVYLGEPAGVPKLRTSALKFRAYACIYNNWFRSEVVTTPVYMHDDDALTQGKNYNSSNYDPVTDTEKGAKLLKACKVFDYFTGATVEAQKGNPVSLPLATYAPITWGTDPLDPGGQYKYGNENTNPDPVKGGVVFTMKSLSNSAGTAVKMYSSVPSSDNTSWTNTVMPTNQEVRLFADLSSATGATVTQLRQCFAIQKFLEKDSLHGSRFGEVIKGHFGVTNPDYRNMIPEYLGGARCPISVNQCIQTSGTDATSPQGNVAGYSVTADKNDDMWTKSFTEWGIVMGLAVVRQTTRSYQQGQNREWAKKKKFDFYWPEFANLSNQEIRVKELYAQGTSDDDLAFGYQEAWSEMRYSNDWIAGELRSDYAQSLDIWHYADWYSKKPTLSTEWLQESEENVGRTLAVQNHDQFFGDFYMDAVWTRPMPIYSIPGLIDHH